MKKILNDTLLGKIIKTFLEGFLASFILSIQTVNDFTNIEFVKPVLIGATAMGLSAVLNLFQTYIERSN